MTRAIAHLFLVSWMLGSAAAAQVPSPALAAPRQVPPPSETESPPSSARTGEETSPEGLPARSESEPEALRAPCKALSLEDVALLGLLGQDDIHVRQLQPQGTSPNPSAPEVLRAFGYRSGEWSLFVLQVRNTSALSKWAPGRMLLTTSNGRVLELHIVRMDPPSLAPGEEGLLAVQPEVATWELGEFLLLHVLGADGSQPLPVLGERL